MKIIEKTIVCETRSVAYNLYALGDLHIGAVNCAEQELRNLIQRIKSDPHALWIGGGDLCDAVILSDIKRFDINTLPDWMLIGQPTKIKERIGDVLASQKHRFISLVTPIKDKCLGLIEGNHEYTIFKYHNHNHLSDLCEALQVPNLTDCAFIRLNFKRKQGSGKNSYCGFICCVVFICHGHGGGRTPGAEPNKLVRLAMDKDADIILTGHTHTFDIIPPVVTLGINRGSTKVVEVPIIKEKHVANWGSFLHTYKPGASSYASRENYPVRPMYTVQTTIIPYCKQDYREYVKINMNRIKL